MIEKKDGQMSFDCPPKRQADSAAAQSDRSKRDVPFNRKFAGRRSAGIAICNSVCGRISGWNKIHGVPDAIWLSQSW